MKFVSSVTRAGNGSFSDVVLNSMPSDGGLYVPEYYPQAPPYEAGISYVDYACRLLSLYLSEDPYLPQLGAICEAAFSFVPELVPCSEDHDLLELFHGPSLSFKDFGAQFLANFVNVMPPDKERLVLVATSGDTGSAVAAAFFQKPQLRVVILYPAQGVSQRQAHQLSCWGDNVTTLAVDGTFDQCQAMVKQALQDPDILERYDLTTANSINIGRLLPQVVYYAYISGQFEQHYGQSMNIVVPSGNLGNVTAACWAKAMGCPLGEIVIAQNANRFVVDYCDTGQLQPRPSIATIANAMDVGAPSNFARLISLFPAHQHFCQALSAYSVSDALIKQTIVLSDQRFAMAICPHTAAAMAVLLQLNDQHPQRWVVAATAHPAKFETVLEPLLQRQLEVPPVLQAQLDRGRCDEPMAADFSRLKLRIVSLLGSV